MVCTALSYNPFHPLRFCTQMAGSGARLPAGRAPGTVPLVRVCQRVAARTRRLDARRRVARAPHCLYAHSVVNVPKQIA